MVRTCEPRPPVQLFIKCSLVRTGRGQLFSERQEAGVWDDFCRNHAKVDTRLQCWMDDYTTAWRWYQGQPVLRVLGVRCPLFDSVLVSVEKCLVVM